jgi:hypothetical protein
VAETPESRILSDVALFRGLPAEQLSKMEARLRRRTLPAGAHVITAEDPDETVYVVLEEDRDAAPGVDRSPLGPRRSRGDLPSHRYRACRASLSSAR